MKTLISGISEVPFPSRSTTKAGMDHRVIGEPLSVLPPLPRRSRAQRNGGRYADSMGTWLRTCGDFFENGDGMIFDHPMIDSSAGS
jgi:hypothetical protein